MKIFLVVLASILAFGSSASAASTGVANTTVTVEISLELEVKNYNGNGDDLNGVVVIGLFGDHVPVASLNFKTLCEGFKRPKEEKLSFKNSYCHRLVKDMLLQCGDIFGLEGHGSSSIYGEFFNDENFDISFNGGGIVGMANKGKDTNGSQFFFTFGASRFFNNRHVAFGKVVRGYQFLAAINKMGSVSKEVKPKRPVRITECSAKDIKKYELSEKDMKTDDLEGLTEL